MAEQPLSPEIARELSSMDWGHRAEFSGAACRWPVGTYIAQVRFAKARNVTN